MRLAAPGAWTSFNGKKLWFFEARKHPARTFSDVKGRVGAVTAIGEQSVFVAAQGGQIEVFSLRLEGGQKLAALQLAAETGLAVGMGLGE